jgi:hypothetical protein
MDLKTLAQEVIYERNDVDVTNIIPNPSTREILAAIYITDKQKTEYFNKDFEAIIKKASDKIGEGSNISVHDISEDMTKFILYSGSDKNPGSYYYYNSTSDKLDPLGI